jgi:uncharacterized protein (TIGR02145 family)
MIRKVIYQSIVVVLIITIGLGSCSKDNNDKKIPEEIDITGETGSLTDYDGNIYKWVGIGTQAWVAENLNSTHFPDGTEIELVSDNESWLKLEDTEVASAYCYYGGVNENNNGALYTYAAAINVCPSGWHLPTDEDWKVLERFLGMEEQQIDTLHCRGLNEGTMLKSITGWNDEKNGTDNYGFNAIPSGIRLYFDGNYTAIGNTGVWWSSSISSNGTPYYRLLDSGSKIFRAENMMSNGYSVRCVRD